MDVSYHTPLNQPTMISFTRHNLLSALVFLLSAQSLKSQGFLDRFDIQGSYGLVNGSLNFQQSYASGINWGMSLNLLAFRNSSISVGNNLRLGYENQYGLGYAYLLGLIVLSLGTGGNNAPNNSPNFPGYAEFPMSLRYNYGYGSSRWSQHKFGFYLGGGMNYLLTGYTNGSNAGATASFWGWNLEGGVRFKNYDLGLYKTFSLAGPVPGIAQPAFYGISLNSFIFRPKNKR